MPQKKTVESDSSLGKDSLTMPTILVEPESDKSDSEIHAQSQTVAQGSESLSDVKKPSELSIQVPAKPELDMPTCPGDTR